MQNQNQTDLQRSKKSSDTSLVSLNSQVIQAGNEKKIREITNPEEPIGKTIMRICFMLGLKDDQLPDTIQVATWIEGIRKYYASYSVDELYIACELNHYGKYPKKIEHYGKFTIDYLSECLKQFDEKKREAILSQKAKTEPVKPKPQLGYHEGRNIYTHLEQWVKTTRSIPMFWDWGKAYSFLKDSGELQDYTRERMIEIFERHKSLGKAEATVGRFSANTIGKLIEFDTLTEDEAIKHACRKFVVHEYLSKKLGLTKIV